MGINMIDEKVAVLVVTSKDFVDGGDIPTRNTGFGEDASPEFTLHNLAENAVSIAILMNDLDIPFMEEYNHWAIWNIPPKSVIPGNIPAGETVPSLGGAVQGIGYGKHRYRGPKQPIFISNTHRYAFHIYVLDCLLDLSSQSRRYDVLNSMKGHVIQQGAITGKYKRSDKNNQLNVKA
ncbi:MAG TPA: YbhB/YbcL family Raf kinase inhibitor-like protein [Lachnospiraceae bacterium]|nr:YbhB/YbcL family Raf kinase inhibitor-like protein [Lachnospiraceae bacterium]